MLGAKFKRLFQKTPDKTLRRILFTFPALAVTASIYMMTTMAWFTDSLDNMQMQIKSGRYYAQVAIEGEGFSLNSGIHGVRSYVCDIPVVDGMTFELRIASYSTSTLGFQYEAEFTSEDGATVSIEKDSVTSDDMLIKSDLLEPGEEDVYTVTVSAPPEGGFLRLQFRTAFCSATIFTAETIEDILDIDSAGSIVYLTCDIDEPDSDLVFSGIYYPNINLGGHSLSVKSITVEAEEDVYSTMDIENGTLIIDGEIYSDTDTIDSTGDGHVTVNLRGLVPHTNIPMATVLEADGIAQDDLELEQQVEDITEQESRSEESSQEASEISEPASEGDADSSSDTESQSEELDDHEASQTSGILPEAAAGDIS